MNCPGCKSADIDPATSLCPCCGHYMTVKEEQRLRGLMVAPRKAVQDDLLDLAERGVT